MDFRSPLDSWRFPFPFFQDFSWPQQKWGKVEFSSELKTEVIFELWGSNWVIWAIVKISFRFRGIPSISVRFWTNGPTKKNHLPKVVQNWKWCLGTIFALRLNSHKFVQIGTSGRIIIRSPPKNLLFHAEQLWFYGIFWLDCTQQRYCSPKNAVNLRRLPRSSAIWPQIKKCYSSKSV